jgi:hypothetical protein
MNDHLYIDNMANGTNDSVYYHKNNKPRYSMKIHAVRVLRMLETLDEPCAHNSCPAFPDLTTNPEFTPSWYWSNDPCYTCRTFAGIEYGCPCIILGKEKNIKHSWIKLEKMGMI